MTTEPVQRLRLLGIPTLRYGSGTLVFAAERRFQLLAFLAHRGEWVSRERIATLFWPEHSAAAARSNLRKVLYRLRDLPRHVLEAAPLEEQRGALRWQVDTDLAAFEQAATHDELEEALAEWQGEPWQGLDDGIGAAFAEWLAIERQRLRGRWRDTLLAAAHRADDPAQALRHAKQALAHDPLDEEALRVAMRALLRSDRRAEAAASYFEFSRRLAESLGLEPSSQTRELLSIAQKGALSLEMAVTPTRADARESTARGSPDVDFIGRQAELRELGALILQPACRWVTLIGPGGIGKSRLLMHALSTGAVPFSDGALIVPLEDLTSPTQVAPRLADKLGVALTGGSEPYGQLAQSLQSSDRLIALDNIEHLLPAVSALSALQQQCSGLRIIATSRERTGATGEWLMPIPGLPFPEREDADRAESFDAVRLFIQRARHANPRFDLNPEREGVVDLCAVVEGMPLAIELSAVWTRHLRPVEIARELRSGGEILQETAGIHIPSRQRSLAATFEHSWQLLVPIEREVLAALSVCSAGFTREAARAVGGASLALLASLIDKSLLRRDHVTTPHVSATTRFSLHPLIQEFASWKLNRLPASKLQAQRSHAEYFGQLLASMPGADQQARQAAYRFATAPDLDNAAIAWRWATANRRTDLLAEMITPLRVLFFSSARRDEGLAMLHEAEAVLATDQPTALPLLDLSRGILEYSLGRFVQASDLLRRALHGLRRGGERSAFRNCLVWLAQTLMALGHLGPARRCLTEGLASARQDNDMMAVSNCLGNLGSIDFTIGHFDSAIAAMQEAIDVRSSIGGDTARLMNNLGLAQLYMGRPAQAIDTLERGLELSRREPNQHARAFFPYNIAQAHLHTGDLVRAEERALESARAIAEGDAPALAISTNALLARIVLRRGEAARARDLLRIATLDARARRLRPLQVGLAIHWAEWLCRSGDVTRAETLLSWAMAQGELEHPDRMFGDQIRAIIEASRAVPTNQSSERVESDSTAESIIDELLLRD